MVKKDEVKLYSIPKPRERAQGRPSFNKPSLFETFLYVYLYIMLSLNYFLNFSLRQMVKIDVLCIKLLYFKKKFMHIYNLLQRLIHFRWVKMEGNYNLRNRCICMKHSASVLHILSHLKKLLNRNVM